MDLNRYERSFSKKQKPRTRRYRQVLILTIMLLITDLAEKEQNRHFVSIRLSTVLLLLALPLLPTGSSPKLHQPRNRFAVSFRFFQLCKSLAPSFTDRVFCCLAFRFAARIPGAGSIFKNSLKARKSEVAPSAAGVMSSLTSLSLKFPGL